MKLLGKFNFDSKTCTYKFTVNHIVFRSKTDVEVLQVVGKHISGKSDFDVESIAFRNFNLLQIPRNIHRFFPNLKVLIMNSCGLRNVSRFDLMGLKKLQQLTLNGNLITALPNNLFENNPMIQKVSFYGNRIELIGAEIFDSLTNLNYVQLRMNVNIDIFYKAVGGMSFEQFKEIIDENCQPKPFEDISDYYDSDDMTLVQENFKSFESDFNDVTLIPKAYELFDGFSFARKSCHCF
jgi:Leucine-rich repeat (LRR) protein